MPGRTKGATTAAAGPKADKVAATNLVGDLVGIAKQHDHQMHASDAVTPDADERKALFVEICSGSAVLSFCFKEAGLEVLPVNHKSNRFHPHVSTLHLDLTKPHSWCFLKRIVEEYNVLFVHAAPPCGTCSRARELPNGPPPLRDRSHVYGLPTLVGADYDRVKAANAI